ncbi:MAG: hypothetical protein SO061_04350 [Limosilactobacillus coleohominis]|nr:hypothetical protein [Limosilactobacillus coleohominis]MDY3702775.1 hypothetical protein [Limosilactobacillus coleohominis]
MPQDDWKFNAPTDLPETVKAIILKPMLVDGIYGLGCSPDNGITNRVYWTIYGRKYYQEDGDRIWPFLIDKVKSVMSINWSDIHNKPDVATQEDLKNIELKPGPQGPQGLPGKDGVTPHIDSTTGDWFIGSQDTGTQAQGPAGKNGRDGVDGQPGKDGQNGITPHIDTATGNWFVGSTDTGIKAQGPQGIQGVPGKDGRNGINGKDGTDVDLSGYAKESEILRPQVSEWSTVGVSLLDGTVQASGNPVRYRVITLGKIHRVEVTGWVTTTIVGGRFNSKVRIPRMGFENATKMSFSGGTTLSAYGDIVSFFAGEPGEINVFSGSKTLNNANFQINCHWTYKE